MVRPVLRVVVVPLEEVDLVLGLDVAVLGHAHVDADRRVVDVLPIQPGVGDGFPGAVDADAAGPGAAAEVLAALVAEFVEVADPRHGGAEVAGLERRRRRCGRPAGFAGTRAASCRWARSGRRR